MKCPQDLNVIVISDAGKLIFSRYEDEDSEEYLCYICGLIQAIRATTLNDGTLDYGEIQYINANDSKIVFMTVGCITMVAIAQKSKRSQNVQINLDDYTESFLQLQLEYVYSGIIFTLTDSVQYMLGDNPSLDVREMLGSTEHVLRDILDAADFDFDPSDQLCMFLGGVNIFGPVPCEVRDYTSKILTAVCSRNKSIIYAILSIGIKLFNIIQPRASYHQLQSFDINLLMHFLTSQTQTTDNELWFPICLPSLSQSGFVHAYQCCVGTDNLKLTIISQDPTVEEFNRLRVIAGDIRSGLGLTQVKESILKVYHLDKHNKDEEIVTDESMVWERITSPTTPVTTNIPAGKNDNDPETITRDLKSLQREKYGYHLLRSLKKGTNQSYQEHLMQSYCEIASATHFVFRYSAPISDCSSGSTSGGGHLSQCYSPSMKFIDKTTDLSKKNILKAYEKLALKLRLGSDSPQAITDAFDNIKLLSHQGEQDSEDGCGINAYRPSQSLYERKPQNYGVTYFKQGNELFLGLSGKNYELYIYFNSDTLPSDAYTLSAVLADTLISDVHDLLHCKPRSF